MFEELMNRVRRAQAEFEFELTNTNDPYRLQYLCKTHQLRMEAFKIEAGGMVRELEED